MYRLPFKVGVRKRTGYRSTSKTVVRGRNKCGLKIIKYGNGFLTRLQTTMSAEMMEK